MKNFYRYLFLFFIAISWVFPENIGYAQIFAPKYSNEFLQIGVGAKAAGMGNAQVSNVDDVTAGYWNPAGLSRLKSKNQFSLMHAEYFAGIASYDYGSFANRIDSNSAIGVSLVRLSIDDIADTRFLIVNDQIDYSRIRKFSASDNAALFHYARNNLFIKGLRFGLSAKIIYRNAGNFANAWGFGADVGLQYEFKKWQFGLQAKDVTSSFNAWNYNTSELAEIYAQTNNNLPKRSIEITIPSYILGVSRKFDFLQHFYAMPAIDLLYTVDGKRSSASNIGKTAIDPRFGLEIGIYHLIFIRSGIQNIQKTKDFAGKSNYSRQLNFGLGLKIKNFYIDYALTDLGNQSEALYSHIFSLKAAF